MALNRGEAAVGEAGGEPVMALFYEGCVCERDATNVLRQTEVSGEKGWGGHRLVVAVWRYMSICKHAFVSYAQ